MIVDERMTSYINSLDTKNTEILIQLEKEAKEQYVPVIRREMQSLLKFFLALKQPKKILEVGTAVGFSSIFMHSYNPVDCNIVTIENYPKRIKAAGINFERAGITKDIQLLKGDANVLLEQLNETFDFIFMDAAKGQYINFLPHVVRLLSENGLLISDNVLQNGDILESRFAVPRRNRTIHKRMREYLYELKHHAHLVTNILPIGDGVTVSTKLQKKECEEL